SERWFNKPLPHTKCRGEDSVTQPTGDVITTEGGPVTLGCTFNSQVANSYLFWYKQGANDHPKYMLMRFKVGTTPGDNAADFKDRFHADVDANANSVPLRIQDLQLTDSAVYYCALKDHSDAKCIRGCTKTYRPKYFDVTWCLAGDGCVAAFFQKFRQPKYNDYTFIAHNSKGFDAYILMHYLANNGIGTTLIANGSKLMIFTDSTFNHRYIDSHCSLPMKL
uniref:Ig-like domain-containing protein n=1 Tax=Esox lucius TaxID=8010 RepID=A0AAY5K0D8_ESOLU